MKHHFEIMEEDGVSTDTTSFEAVRNLYILRNYAPKPIYFKV